MSDLALRPATEIARRLRRREWSAVELLQQHLQRIGRLNPALNAVVVLDAERALQRARAADDVFARWLEDEFRASCRRRSRADAQFDSSRFTSSALVAAPYLRISRAR